MKLDVLKALHSTIPREQLCEAYETATGEKINLELVDQLIKTKKKQNILTIEKELLSSYMEAVADMKQAVLQSTRPGRELSTLEQVVEVLKKSIDKHAKRISDSGIWQ